MEASVEYEKREETEQVVETVGSAVSVARGRNLCGDEERDATVCMLPDTERQDDAKARLSTCLLLLDACDDMLSEALRPEADSERKGAGGPPSRPSLETMLDQVATAGELLVRIRMELSSIPRAQETLRRGHVVAGVTTSFREM